MTDVRPRRAADRSPRLDQEGPDWVEVLDRRVDGWLGDEGLVGRRTWAGVAVLTVGEVDRAERREETRMRREAGVRERDVELEGGASVFYD